MPAEGKAYLIRWDNEDCHVDDLSHHLFARQLKNPTGLSGSTKPCSASDLPRYATKSTRSTALSSNWTARTCPSSSCSGSMAPRLSALVGKRQRRAPWWSRRHWVRPEVRTLYDVYVTEQQEDDLPREGVCPLHAQGCSVGKNKTTGPTTTTCSKTPTILQAAAHAVAKQHRPHQPDVPQDA